MSGAKRAPPAFPLPLERIAAASAPRALLRPQRPLQIAAEAASRGEGAPLGVGLDSQQVRTRMVERLRRERVAPEPVLAALARVPRHRFVDTALGAQAYEDTSLPIGHGQTISKPSVVARMLGLLFEGANARAGGSLGRVLEIGTGCGYQAAVLAELSRQVLSIERVKPLHERARANLAALREHRIRLVYGDGRRGHPPNAPYDSIIAAAGGDSLPPAWLEQLAEGGRLVAPQLDVASGRQLLAVIDRTARGFVHSRAEAVLFVPLKSGVD